MFLKGFYFSGFLILDRKYSYYLVGKIFSLGFGYCIMFSCEDDGWDVFKEVIYYL